MTHGNGNAAGYAAQYIDDSILPQDDLFGHVNGKWLESAEFRADLAMVGGFVDLSLEAEAEVGEILREASEAASAGLAAPGSDRQKVGDLVASFMDEDRVEALGHAPLANDLAAIAALQDLPGLPGCLADSNVRTWARSSTAMWTPMTVILIGTSSTSGRAGSVCPTRRSTARMRSLSTVRSTWRTYPPCCNWSVDLRRTLRTQPRG